MPFAFNGTIDKLTINLGPMQIAERGPEEGGGRDRGGPRLAEVLAPRRRRPGGWHTVVAGDRPAYEGGNDGAARMTW